MDRRSKEIIAAISVALGLVAVSYGRAKWLGSTTFLSRVLFISVWLIVVIVWVLVKVKD
jgi:hypothetical protein